MRGGRRGIGIGLPPAARDSNSWILVSGFASLAHDGAAAISRASARAGATRPREPAAPHGIVAHHPLEQGVGDRDDRHPLVVCHERADDRDLLSVQQPRGVKSSASKYPKRPRAPRAAKRVKLRAAATGSIIAASAVA